MLLLLLELVTRLSEWLASGRPETVRFNTYDKSGISIFCDLSNGVFGFSDGGVEVLENQPVCNISGPEPMPPLQQNKTTHVVVTT